MRTVNGYLSRMAQRVWSDAIVYEDGEREMFVLERQEGELLGLGREFHDAKQSVIALWNKKKTTQWSPAHTVDEVWDSVEKTGRAAVIVMLPHQGGRLLVPVFVALEAITGKPGAGEEVLLARGIKDAVADAMKEES